MRKAMPAPQLGSGMEQNVLSGCLFLLLTMGAHCLGQAAGPVPEPIASFGSHGSSGAAATPDKEDSEPASLPKWPGLPVREISFEGVSADRLKPLSDHLPQTVGAPLSRENVADSLRKMYATGSVRHH